MFAIEQLDDLENKITNSLKELGEARLENEQFMYENDRLQHEIDKIRNLIPQKTSELEKLKNELETSKNELNSLRQMSTGVEKKVFTLLDTVNSLQEQNNKLRKNYTGITEKKETQSTITTDTNIETVIKSDSTTLKPKSSNISNDIDEIYILK